VTRRKGAAPRAWVRLAAVGVTAAATVLTTVGVGASTNVVAPKQLGFNSYVQDLCQSNATWASDAVDQFRELAGLGANSIALAFPIYMTSLNSSTVFASKTCGTNFQTPSPARLAVAIRVAHSLHLKVFLRPLISETTLKAGGGWRGTIHPLNEERWFTSYLAVLTPYLRLAQQLHVESFAVSTELDSLATASNWSTFIRNVRRYYKGSLVFTVTWTQNASGKVRHGGTSPGMDTYQLASLPDDATPSELLTAWNNALAHTNTVPFSLSSATIDEVAILAQDGAYSTPWVWSLPAATHPFDPRIQANWYSMVCSFFKSHNMRGIYFWGIWYSAGGSAVLTTPEPGLAQEIQPASAAVIKRCYTGR
jgi:hypothetical protein